LVSGYDNAKSTTNNWNIKQNGMIFIESKETNNTLIRGRSALPLSLRCEEKNNKYNYYAQTRKQRISTNLRIVAVFYY